MLSIIHSKVLLRARKLPAVLVADVLTILQKIIVIDEKSKGAISLLARRVSEALPKGKRMANDILLELGSAQIFGWAAYTAYDSILDHQMLNAILPAANICNYFFSEYYNQTGLKNFKRCFSRIVQGIEAANSWEQANARNPLKLPNYDENQILADRGMGHALGALAVIVNGGYSESTPEFEAVENFFRNYIIAKQLHDDACDWQEDLTANRISPIVAMVLSATSEPSKQVEYFEKHGRHLAAQQILDALAKAENCLFKLASVLDVGLLLVLLKPLKSGALANY
jgi:hypothetical protein